VSDQTQDPQEPDEGVLAEAEAIVEDEAEVLAVAEVLADEPEGPLVSLVVGTPSDREVMERAAEVLREAEVSYEMEVASAHREPLKLAEHCGTARARGIRVIIAGAGLGAALPGIAAAHTDLPVIGVPLSAATSVSGGLDALLAIAQTPQGVPVATVGLDAAENAAHLAVRILSIR
jgi:5-(carboxyamino)imidazole ribonucleotide mutase